MNRLYEFLSCKNVIDRYYKNISVLNYKSVYQHFLTRLKLVEDIDLPDDIFNFTVDEMMHLLDIDIDTYWQEALNKDENGYLKDINNSIKENTDYADDIKFYFYITQLACDITVLKRNHAEYVDEFIDEALEYIDDTVIKRIIKISDNTLLREYEGTVCVNGIGYLFELCEIFKNDKMCDLLKDKLKELFLYYIEHCNNCEQRNMIYGLTHCIINITHFYTQSPFTYEIFNQYLYAARDKIGKLLEKEKNSLFTNVNSDMLAEMTLCYKILSHDVIDDLAAKAIYMLTTRIDRNKGYICTHPSIDFAHELERNEHTNILYILCQKLLLNTIIEH